MGFQLVEFDPAQHETLNGLFDRTHEDTWKVLFKGAEVPPPTTKDRGFCTKPSQRGKLFLPLTGYSFFIV